MRRARGHLRDGASLEHRHPRLPAPQSRGATALTLADNEATLKEFARQGTAAVEVTAAAGTASGTAAVGKLTAAAAQEMGHGGRRWGSVQPSVPQPSQAQLDLPRNSMVNDSPKHQSFGVGVHSSIKRSLRVECSGKVQNCPGTEGGQEEGTGAGKPLGPKQVRQRLGSLGQQP